MKIFKKLLLPILILCSVTACSSNRELRFGAAGIGGNYYLFGETFAKQAAADTGLKFEVKETAGSAANLRLLNENYIQIAIAQSDLIDEALKSGSRDFYAVASLYPEYCHIIVKEDSGIADVADLLGKTVSVGDEESGTEKNAEQILKACGISETLIKTVNMSYTEAAEALKSGEIDAMFATMGMHTSVVEGLAEDAEIRLLPIEGDALSILLNSYDFYEERTIPAGTYNGQEEDVATIGVNSVLLMNSLVPEDTAYTITKELFEHVSDIQNEMPLTLELDLSGITIPFHPGAEKYFTEAGIDMSAADGR